MCNIQQHMELIFLVEASDEILLNPLHSSHSTKWKIEKNS